MSALEIISIGPLSSVQDRGRFGAQRYGLTPSGAMDVLALATANALVANEAFAAAIEIGPFGATFKAQGLVTIGLAGAARPASRGSQSLQWPQSVTLRDGDVLTLGFAREGLFSYLALHGGVQGEPVYGSLSVNARAGLGSPYPRPLQAGDRLACAPQRERPAHIIDLPKPDAGPIGIVFGPQDDEFADDVRRRFLDAEWTISPTSDRMGYRLEGPAIAHAHGHNIVSDGTVLGSIQIPGNGAPIVLMPDRGTSGGYPKIATIASADFGRFAQMPAGRPFRFKALTVAEAQAAARAFASRIASLPGCVAPWRDGTFDLDALVRANVAGAAVSATDARSWQSSPDGLTSEPSS